MTKGSKALTQPSRTCKNVDYFIGFMSSHC